MPSAFHNLVGDIGDLRGLEDQLGIFGKLPPICSVFDRIYVLLVGGSLSKAQGMPSAAFLNGILGTYLVLISMEALRVDALQDISIKRESGSCCSVIFYCICNSGQSLILILRLKMHFIPALSLVVGSLLAVRVASAKSKVNVYWVGVYHEIKCARR